MPGFYELTSALKLTSKGTGGSNSARYCYSVWLRHLVMAHNSGLPTKPQVIAELGPGDSLGVGLAALLSGAEKYFALDVLEYANTQANLDIFDELVTMFTRKEPIPGPQEFPRVKPFLQSYEFPSHILSDDRLRQTLNPGRVEAVKSALTNFNNPDKSSIEISYFVPWSDAGVIKEQSVDMIFSQAVLEHVGDLPHTYKALYRWLKADGFMSHEIDFSSHGRAKHWNGHWAYSELTWRLIKGKSLYLLNREPYSIHHRLMQESGFEIVHQVRVADTSGITRKQLSSRFYNMSDDDLKTRGVYLVARKRP